MKLVSSAALALALAIAASGCVIVDGHHARSSSALSAKKCPPGHQWSDGACHSKGKGHDK